MKKNITLITSSRADWSYLLPLAKALRSSSKFNLRLVATGSHFLKEYGNSYKDILKSGLKIDRKIIIALKSDTPASISQSLGSYTEKFSQEFSQNTPDLIVFLGDRMEILSIALSALPFSIPLVHIGGGDITQGAVDEGVRHALSKLSHVHFVSTKAAKQIIEQMGEEPWRVHHTGSLGIDSIKNIQAVDIKILKEQVPFIEMQNFLLVTYHPQTISSMKVEDQIKWVLKGLQKSGKAVVFTYPNIDMTNKAIITAIEEYVGHHPNSLIIKNAGTRMYYSLVRYAAAVVGNSSSGIYDTPFLGTPAVNIGERQLGRLKADNVIDVGFNDLKIAEAIKKACSKEFHQRSSKRVITHFFGDGHAAEKIVRVLATLPYKNLLKKKFKIR